MYPQTNFHHNDIDHNHINICTTALILRLLKFGLSVYRTK